MLYRRPPIIALTKTISQPREAWLGRGKEVGHVTNAVHSPTLNAIIALGYVRREANAVGTELRLRTGDGECAATIEALPFVK